MLCVVLCRVSLSEGGFPGRSPLRQRRVCPVRVDKSLRIWHGNLKFTFTVHVTACRTAGIFDENVPMDSAEYNHTGPALMSPPENGHTLSSAKVTSSPARQTWYQTYSETKVITTMFRDTS